MSSFAGFSQILDEGGVLQGCQAALALVIVQLVEPLPEIGVELYPSPELGYGTARTAPRKISLREVGHVDCVHSFLFFKGVVGNVFHKEKLMHQLYFIRGSWNGFTGDMELGKIIKDFKPDEDNKGL